MKSLTNTELISFCSQLAMILKSGISSAEGLSLMLEDTPQGEGRQILESVLRETENGSMLYQALSSCPAFPPYLCSMVEIGENSGRLDEVMESLSEHYRREENLARSIRGAVAYPLVMLGMMIAVMLVLIIKVMPVFQQVFEQLGAGMTGISAAVLDLGGALSRYGAVLLAVVAAAAAAFLFFFFTENGRRKAASFGTRFFATRALTEKIACSRFASGMYLSLSSGLNVDQSLEMTERLVEHPVVKARIRQIRDLTAEGMSFTEAAEQSGIFSGLYVRMLSIGFKAGAFDEVMKQISAQYDEEIETRMNSLVARLEPTLVALLSIIVGVILLSVMLPLMGIMSNIG